MTHGNQSKVARALLVLFLGALGPLCFGQTAGQFLLSNSYTQTVTGVFQEPGFVADYSSDGRATGNYYLTRSKGYMHVWHQSVAGQLVGASSRRYGWFTNGWIVTRARYYIEQAGDDGENVVGGFPVSAMTTVQMGVAHDTGTSVWYTAAAGYGCRWGFIMFADSFDWNLQWPIVSLGMAIGASWAGTRWLLRLLRKTVSQGDGE